MAKKLTTEEFIERAKKVHGNKYDYSKTKYVNKRTKICIICPIHGEQWQLPMNHIYGQGCPECGKIYAKDYVKKTRSLGLEGFLNKAREIHGDKYDFSLVTSYESNKDNIQVICNRCGNIFNTKPNWILTGHGCKHCETIKKCLGKDILNAAETFYGDEYKFPDIDPEKEYWVKDYTTMVCKIHGNIRKRIDKILSGGRCTICGKLIGSKNAKLPQNEVKKRLLKLCNNKFDYNFEEYENTQKPLHFTCKKCNKTFVRDLNTLMYNSDCPFCKKNEISKSRTKTTEEFIEQCKHIYGNLYDYSNTEYVASDKKITAKCNQCNKYFSVEANSHLQGHGCPNHYRNKSKIEEEVFNYVKKIANSIVIENYRDNKEIKEIDIYVPSYKIGIEIDGLFWHNELNKEKDYHLNKTIACEKNGIRLIHIFEDEWLYKQDILKSMLKNILGKTPNKIYARKCVIKDVVTKEASDFLLKNHLQGKCGSSIKIGLYYNNELVSLMCFGKSRHFIGNGKTQWELLRFCNKLDTTVVGGASKLLNYFIKTYNPEEIISYADRRWSNGNLYEKLGFVKYNESKPNYYYIIGQKRIYRFNLRKNVLIEKYGCPIEMSEHDFCLSKKWYRIYDCGCLCYVWKNKN